MACHATGGRVWQAGPARCRGCGRRPWWPGRPPAREVRLLQQPANLPPLDVPSGSGRAAWPCIVLRREVFIILAAGRREVGAGSARNTGTGSALLSSQGMPELEAGGCHRHHGCVDRDLCRGAPGCHRCLLLKAKIAPASMEWEHCPLLCTA